MVFETTADPSAININQVHMLMDFTDDRVRVSEIYVLSNRPRPCLWVNQAILMKGPCKLALPAGAENVEFQRSFRSFENFFRPRKCCPRSRAMRIQLPIRPGEGAMNLLVSYELPFEEGMRIAHPVFYETEQRHGCPP